ncbi:MAG: hypothetical protein HZB91_06350 [Elusimicrobia bacterium]|nr:hypothetical protein [Elusimicrobiota bacterium]
MAFSHRSLERADAALKRLSDSLPQALRGSIDKVRKVLDPIRQREALIAKLRSKVARYESQLAGVRRDLDREHADLITARMKACKIEEAAALTQKNAFDAALDQSKREEKANQTASVMTRELKNALVRVAASLNILAEEARLRRNGDEDAKELESCQYQLGQAADLVENLRFYLKQ